MLTLQQLGFIGSDYAKKLQSVGIHSPEDLVQQWGDNSARANLVQKTGISENLFERWYRMCTFLRIDGVTPEYAELLERVGVHTVQALGEYDPNQLLAKFQEMKNLGEFQGALPTLDQIRNFIQTAQSSQTREGAVS